MPKSNQEIAESLSRFSDLLEASGDNPYRVRAYRRAARSILNLKENLERLVANGFDLTSLPWVGNKIASTIIHLITTNEELILREDQKQKKLNELKDIQRLGEQKIKILNEQYGIYKKIDLLNALEKNKLGEIKGFNQKFVAHLKKEIKKPRKNTKFLRLYHAVSVVESLLKHLRSLTEVLWVECAGSFRRKKEVIEELDFIVCTENFLAVSHHLSQFNSVKDMIKQSHNLISVNLRVGIKMNLHWVSNDAFGAALLFFTGNNQHLSHLMQLAAIKDYTLTESGLFKENQWIAGKTEQEIYQALDLTYLAPELREDKGEIDAARKNQLPELIQLQDIKGDLHSHTNETDGREPLENMVMAAIAKGYQYLAITDHSKHLTITHGLDEKRLRLQMEKIDKLNEQLNGFLILKSIEVDILEDGSLDLSNDVLKELDIVLCSIHSKFNLPEEIQTARIIKAMDNPYFNILGHATGRLIKSRPPYPINMENILIAAKNRGCFVELNAQPYRLDINDNYCQLAKKIGVKIAISSDAHSLRDFNYMQFGIFQGRRGWLEKSDVLNTCPWSHLKKLLKRT